MTRLLLAGIGLIAAFGFATAQDKKEDDRVKVEVLLATEHVPEGLKAGTRVNLMMVTGKTVTPKGQVAYTTGAVALDIEIASVEKVDKPATPEAAVKVNLLMPKDTSAKVEKARDQMVMTFERQADGTIVRKMKPITLRLELPKADKK
jgi:hypothetical protein